MMGGKNNVLYKELSYKIWGAALEVRKNFGPGHKEKLYQEAFADELLKRDIEFEREKAIRIYHPETGKAMHCGYQPDFIIEKKVIVELKAVPLLPKREVDQLYGYLRNSQYELGYRINFSSSEMKPIRITYTNNYKGWFRTLKNIGYGSHRCFSVLLSVFFSAILSVGVFILFFSFSVYAADKQWSGAGDALSWEDPYNWSSFAIPLASDDVSIDAQDASVLASKTFSVKSLVVGGRKESSFATADFIYATVTPDKNSDNALYIRKGGSVTLRGVGDITLKGAFKNSEESLSLEPGFMFGAE